MEKSVGKIASIIYALTFIYVSASFLLSMFFPVIFTPFFGILGGEFFLLFIVFLVLGFVYKRQYNIKSCRGENKFSRLIRLSVLIASVIMILSLVITTYAFDVSDGSLSTDYIKVYSGEINHLFMFLRQVGYFIMIFASILFVFDYFKKGDVISRYCNIKEMMWSLLFFSVLISFSKTIALMIYDLFLVTL